MEISKYVFIFKSLCFSMKREIVGQTRLLKVGFRIPEYIEAESTQISSVNSRTRLLSPIGRNIHIAWIRCCACLVPIFANDSSSFDDVSLSYADVSWSVKSYSRPK